MYYDFFEYANSLMAEYNVDVRHNELAEDIFGTTDEDEISNLLEDDYKYYENEVLEYIKDLDERYTAREEDDERLRYDYA